MDRRARNLGLAVIATGLAVAFSGCIAINSVSTAQPESMGPLQLGVSACASGSPGCSGSSNTGSMYGFLQAADADDTFQVQVLVALRLPDGAVPPDNLLAVIGGGGFFGLARSSSYEAELQALEPAPAGERWWGWISGQLTYGRNTKQSFSVSIQTTLPRPADGGPLPTPMRWRPVVGGRFVDANTPALVVGRPVQCGNTNDHLYNGYTESGSGTPTVVCIDSPTPDAARGFLGAPLIDFGLLGTDLEAPAGSTVTATFLAKRSGEPDFGTTFDLAATGGPPGGTITLDRTTVSLGGDSTTPVLAELKIPAGTPPGAYPITLTATASGKPTRTATATLTVPDPAAPPDDGPDAPPDDGPDAPPASGTDVVAPSLQASLARRRFRRSTKLKVGLSEAAGLTGTVKRARPGRRSRGRCSTKARRGRRCTVLRRVGTFSRALPAGTSRIAFSRRLGTRRLKPGAYRLVLVARDAAGNRSAKRTLRFRILRR